MGQCRRGSEVPVKCRINEGFYDVYMNEVISTWKAGAW